MGPYNYEENVLTRVRGLISSQDSIQFVEYVRSAVSRYVRSTVSRDNTRHAKCTQYVDNY